jgi:hypothetical protein
MLYKEASIAKERAQVSKPENALPIMYGDWKYIHN